MHHTIRHWLDGGRGTVLMPAYHHGVEVADPFGRVVAEASHDQEEILVAEIDPRQAEEVRRNWPFLRDRRIDAYAPILQRLID